MTTRPNLISKTYKIREDTAEKITQIAHSLDVSEAVVVRRILAEYFDTNTTVGLTAK